MKQTIFTALLITVSLLGYGQSTIETEYNYMKVGYKTTEESGLDVKAGYTVEEISSDEKYPNVTITAKLLRRSDNTIAGAILKITESGLLGSDVTYYAMPAASTKAKKSYGWNLWFKDIEAMSTYKKQAVLKWLSYEYMFQYYSIK